MRQFYSLSSDLHTWNSFHVYAIDGSTIQIPESKENYEVFGSNPNKAEKISPLASVSVLYDVMNDILVDVSLHSYCYNERESSLFIYPSFGNKESLNFRSIYFLLENGNIEYLVTNLMLEKMTAANFPDLYRLRWGAESKHKELKNRFAIEAFNSVKSVSIRQEFFAAMYLSNLAAIIELEADSKIAASAGNRHDYQSNRSYILNQEKSCIIRFMQSFLCV